MSDEWWVEQDSDTELREGLAYEGYELVGEGEESVDDPRLETYWNGERTPARRVRVRVGPSAAPTWWCADLEGTIREAVEVTYGRETFYLDNENGQGWLKVTVGRGSPQYGHASLPATEVLGGSDG